MKVTGAPEKPLARTDNLIVRELADEVLVYDLERQKAHCLNRTAALVWRGCNGRTSVAELAALVVCGSDSPADKKVVWLALRQLAGKRLLAAKLVPPAEMSSVTRRQMIRALGAGLALPLVTSIVAPTPAQASYGAPPGTCCQVNSECQSGRCTVADGSCGSGFKCM